MLLLSKCDLNIISCFFCIFLTLQRKDTCKTPFFIRKKITMRFFLYLIFIICALIIFISQLENNYFCFTYMHLCDIYFLVKCDYFFIAHNFKYFLLCLFFWCSWYVFDFLYDSCIFLTNLFLTECAIYSDVKKNN